MKQVSKEVTYKGESVGNVEVQVYESLDEAEMELGEKTLLSYVNRLNSITAMDEFRRKHAKRPPSMREIAKKLKADPALLAEVQSKLSLEEA